MGGLSGSTSIDVKGCDSAHQALKYKISDVSILGSLADDALVFFWLEHDTRHPQQLLIRSDRRP